MAELGRILVCCLAAMHWFGLVACAGDGGVDSSVHVAEAAARQRADITALQRELDSENALTRRAAIRALADIGAPAEQALTAALVNDDLVVRRAALIALAGEPSPAAVAHLAKALADTDSLVRRMAVQLLAAVRPPDDRVFELLRQAEKDPSVDVQRVAVAAMAKLSPSADAFHPPTRDTVPLRQRPDMVDHVARLTVAFTLPLLRDGWRFRVDPNQEGHVQKWFESGFDDARWTETSIETPWTPGYMGVGWYRTSIDLPPRPKHLAAELLFEGVDECAWVWVNGVYVGGQDVGPDGWNQPFRVEVTEELRWNARNQITVRVMNTAFAGGIWKPVRLEAIALE